MISISYTKKVVKATTIILGYSGDQSIIKVISEIIHYYNLEKKRNSFKALLVEPFFY